MRTAPHQKFVMILPGQAGIIGDTAAQCRFAEWGIVDGEDRGSGCVRQQNRCAQMVFILWIRTKLFLCGKNDKGNHW